MSRPRVLSGIQPTADSFHLGNYLGAIRQWVALQDSCDAFYCVVDLHPITVPQDPALLRRRTRVAAAQLFGAGLDPARCTVFVQSQIPEHAELGWVMSCLTGFGEASRMIQFKDKSLKSGSDQASVGLFTYPILQAADILAVDADLVPVGKDQVQHLELARDMAARFNEEFKADVFKLPAYRLAPDADVLPGIDGEKMSKSYGNTIDPFLDEKALRKRVMAVKTDSTPVEAAKDPETCAVYRIFRGVAGKDDPRTVELANRYRAGGMGYGHAKQALFELLLDRFADARKRRAELMADPAHVDRVLASGAAAARAKARVVVDRARAACGL
jgi:tryptophanyl-tRNA synthetase